MPNDKRKRAQPSKKRKQPKKVERAPQRRGDEPMEPSIPAQPAQPGQPGTRRRPGEGLDRSNEGVVAGGRLAGQRFMG